MTEPHRTGGGCHRQREHQVQRPRDTKALDITEGTENGIV